MTASPDVDAAIAASTLWPAESAAVRGVLLGAGLDEALKWNKPCYSLDGSNICILQEMKAFLALMFFKGALLDDPAGLLVAQGPNSRSAKRMEFTSVPQIEAQADAIRQFVAAAVAVERAGLEVPAAPEPDWVPELVDRLGRDDALRAGFESLTPGRRREYHLYFASAKKSETRTARIDKYAARIADGRGMRDR